VKVLPRLRGDAFDLGQPEPEEFSFLGAFPGLLGDVPDLALHLGPPSPPVPVVGERSGDGVPANRSSISRCGWPTAA
jgi:hypothetical protein